MLWQMFSLKKRLSSWFPNFLTIIKPESEKKIKRLQFFWMSCLVLGALALSYGVVFFLVKSPPSQIEPEPPKLVPTNIETASQKVDLNEARWYKVDEENKKLSDQITDLRELFEEGMKEPSAEMVSENNDSDENNTDERIAHTSTLESRILQLEEKLENPQIPLNSPYGQENLAPSGEDQKKNLIHKFSLGSSGIHPSSRSRQTVDTTIPAGSFARTVLLSGLDASSAMNASSDPRPMLLRIIDPGTLPRRFQSDLKDCHCTASAYGDLSSERVYARLEKLTCIERKTGQILETQVAGYITGSDGKAGIRGIVASKDGQFLVRSLMGGMFAGLSNVANPQNRQSMVSPFAPGSAQVSPPNMGEMFTSGMATGVTTALDRLSQYYIDRAEQLQPVIQIAAGQVVDIVFTEGAPLGGAVISNQSSVIRKKEGD